MIRITIVPRAGINLYGAVVKKEVVLSRSGKGTLYRSGRKMKDYEKWAHKSYNGWIWIEKCIGQVVVAAVQSRKEGHDNQLLGSFVAFLDRHFRADIVSITINYE
ncbi:MAG: hypothetical protein J0L78_06115 [Planctomycetes bacterium]|nr:hypothetical protein [Planctomycetota bacterium]